MSDLHGYLPKAIEQTELTLICGDILPLHIQRDVNRSRKWINGVFSYWSKNWPSEKIIFIAGNHDFIFDGHWLDNDTLKLKESTKGKLEYLNGVTTFENITIYGTPYCKIFGNWAFMRTDEALREYYESMPENCDIVISHDAADINDLGMIPENNPWTYTKTNAGNKVLAEFIKSRKPKYYFCGHIHEGNHRVTEVDGTTMANVSILNDRYQFYYEPLYLDI